MDNKKEKKGTIEVWQYLNGTLISHKVEELEGEWKREDGDPVFQSMKKNIGIGSIHNMYIETNEIQDVDYEYNKILKFLKKYQEHYSQKNNVNIEDLKIEFINYGKTELVYVLTENNGKRVTLLVKQPAVEFGQVKKEAEILNELKKVDNHVVNPIDYFKFGDQELYVTPYINQARCVASDYSWGMYIPEPYYRFESFTQEQQNVVTQCMIAKLVSLYDFTNQEGLKSCKLGGGDFMLPKGWEDEEPTIENTLNNLYLIAARDKVNCTFDEYLDTIRREFSMTTIDKKQEDLIINIRGRVPMNVENIEEGIKLGKKIITKRNNFQNKLNNKR